MAAVNLDAVKSSCPELQAMDTPSGNMTQMLAYLPKGLSLCVPLSFLNNEMSNPILNHTESRN
jgi:hypothetical protein